MVIGHNDYDGIEAGKDKDYNCELDLAKVHKNLTPSCDVHMIKNRHEQEVVFIMDGTVCGEMPKIEVPIVISKGKPKPFLGFVPPPGMMPQVLGNCVLKVPKYKPAK